MLNMYMDMQRKYVVASETNRNTIWKSFKGNCTECTIQTQIRTDRIQTVLRI